MTLKSCCGRKHGGKKALQSSSWFVWENSWDLAAVVHRWQCPQSCTFCAFRRQEHDWNWVLGCRDVTSGMTSPTWMWHPPTPLPFTSALFPERWRPHQAIRGILCAMGIEQASQSVHCNSSFEAVKLGAGAPTEIYIELSPIHIFSLKWAKPINISIPSQQQNLHSLNNIVNTARYYSYTSHL